MKTISFETLFLLCSVMLAIGFNWSVWSCIIVIAAAILMLCDVLPKIWRYYHESKKNPQ